MSYTINNAYSVEQTVFHIGSFFSWMGFEFTVEKIKFFATREKPSGFYLYDLTCKSNTNHMALGVKEADLFPSKEALDIHLRTTFIDNYFNMKAALVHVGQEIEDKWMFRRILLRNDIEDIL